MAAQTTLADINATLQKMKVGQDKVLDELQDQDKSSAQRAKDRLKEPKKPGSGGPGGPGGGPQKPQSKLTKTNVATLAGIGGIGAFLATAFKDEINGAIKDMNPFGPDSMFGKAWDGLAGVLEKVNNPLTTLSTSLLGTLKGFSTANKQLDAQNAARKADNAARKAAQKQLAAARAEELKATKDRIKAEKDRIKAEKLAAKEAAKLKAQPPKPAPAAGAPKPEAVKAAGAAKPAKIPMSGDPGVKPGDTVRAKSGNLKVAGIDGTATTINPDDAKGKAEIMKAAEKDGGKSLKSATPKPDVKVEAPKAATSQARVNAAVGGAQTGGAGGAGAPKPEAIKAAGAKPTPGPASSLAATEADKAVKVEKAATAKVEKIKAAQAIKPQKIAGVQIPKWLTKTFGTLKSLHSTLRAWIGTPLAKSLGWVAKIGTKLLWPLTAVMVTVDLVMNEAKAGQVPKEETIKNRWKIIGEAAGGILGGLLGACIGSIIFPGIGTFILGMILGILGSYAGGKLGEIMYTLTTHGVSAAMAMLPTPKEMAVKAWEILKGSAEGAADMVIDAGKWVGRSIGDATSAAGSYISGKAAKAYEMVKGGAKAAADTVKEVGGVVADKAKMLAAKAADTAVGRGAAAVGGAVAEGAEAAYEGAKDLGKSALGFFGFGGSDDEEKPAAKAAKAGDVKPKPIDVSGVRTRAATDEEKAEFGVGTGIPMDIKGGALSAGGMVGDMGEQAKGMQALMGAAGGEGDNTDAFNALANSISATNKAVQQMAETMAQSGGNQGGASSPAPPVILGNNDRDLAQKTLIGL